MTSFFVGLLILFLGGIISCLLPQNFKTKFVTFSTGLASVFCLIPAIKTILTGERLSSSFNFNEIFGDVNFDMGRFGIDFVASPRHADGIVITGPISKNMAYALENCYNSVPNPKLVILCGACAISGGVYQDSDEILREFLEKYHVDLYIPGCPVHPLTFINGVLSIIK